MGWGVHAPKLINIVANCNGIWRALKFMESGGGIRTVSGFDPIADIWSMCEKQKMRSTISFASKAVLAIVALPFAAIAGLAAAILGLRTQMPAYEVANDLRNFLAGTSGQWDWDDFTSVTIADPNLESIRRKAADVDLPLTEEGFATLRDLLAEAEGLERRGPKD